MLGKFRAAAQSGDSTLQFTVNYNGNWGASDTPIAKRVSDMLSRVPLVKQRPLL